jgi:HAD superfamily hydrolase (TIGR01509 family)
MNGAVLPWGMSPGSRRGRGDATHGSLPEAVLFDLDDTIFDHALTSRNALGCLRQEQAFLRRRPLGSIWTEYSRLLEAVHPAIVAGLLDLTAARVERFRRLAGFCGVRISEDEAASLSRTYRSYYQRLRRPVPGVRRVLEGLHGRTVVGVVTNNQVAEQEEKLSFLGVRDLVDFLVISEGVGVSKPDPRIFEIALDHASAEPSEAVMVGDSWPNDVLGARAAGIRAVWFNRFGAPNPEPQAVAQLDSFRSLRRVHDAISDDGPGPRALPR